MRTRAVLLALLLLCGGCAKAVDAQAAKVYGMRASDAVAAYEQARLSGDPLDRCVKARLVAAAYEEARQPASVAAWRAKEREDCAEALAALGVEGPAD